MAWYHHFTHIACGKKLRWLRQKLDALRVQTGPSTSKYEGFERKLICYKGISFFLTYFDSKLFVHREEEGGEEGEVEERRRGFQIFDFFPNILASKS